MLPEGEEEQPAEESSSEETSEPTETPSNQAELAEQSPYEKYYK